MWVTRGRAKLMLNCYTLFTYFTFWVTQICQPCILHSSITSGQSDMLESLQKQALKVILSNNDHYTSLILASMVTLCSHRECIIQRFYRQNSERSSSCFNCLLPEQCDDVVNKLRHTNKCTLFSAKTKYNSCIPYCVAKFWQQWLWCRPSFVAEWLMHSAAMCIRAWRAQWLGFDSAQARPPTKELFQIIPMHMINRQIIPGRKKRVGWCPI